MRNDSVAMTVYAESIYSSVSTLLPLNLCFGTIFPVYTINIILVFRNNLRKIRKGRYSNRILPDNINKIFMKDTQICIIMKEFSETLSYSDYLESDVTNFQKRVSVLHSDN